MEQRAERTPMMVQYHQIKSENRDSILFFRLGDFYEMFEEDAVTVSGLLNLTLTKRNGIPMCGIPYHAAKNYIKRLLDAGMKIAICEQTTLNETGRGLATREVVQIVTPATVVEDDFLDSRSDSFVLAIALFGDEIATSYADLSSAQFFLRSLERDGRYLALSSLIEEIRPTEILVNEDAYYGDGPFKDLLDSTRAMITKLPSWHFAIEGGVQRLCSHFDVATLKGFGLEGSEAVIAAGGALIWYLGETAKASLAHLRSCTLVDQSHFLRIDEASRRSLELFTNQIDGSSRFSLFASIDRCRTSMGSRKLKRWLASPLTDIDAILFRQRWVNDFVDDRSELNRVRSLLKEALDLERLASRLSMARHLPKDLVGISTTIKTFFAVMESRYADLLDSAIDETQLKWLIDLAQMIDRAINAAWQGGFEEGRVILDGYDQILDEKRSLKGGGAAMLEAYLGQVREQTGISQIKLSSNKVHGHFLEVSKIHAAKMPSAFFRKQTLVNAERFTSDELIALEEKILSSSFEAEKREREVYEAVVGHAQQARALLLAISGFLSDLDALASMGWLAIEHNYCKPTFTDEDQISIVQGRHAVVEQHLGVGQFVANDLTIHSAGERFCLITGPNMAGKSTFLRQNALIVILAQIGGWVPAKQARLGIVDRLYCRVGSADNLARGESTFLIEMQEAAHILNTASRHSFVIVDELGRGTSTQDGMAIAYAVMRRLIALGAKTLFATHYHELAHTDTSSVQLLTLEVSESGSRIRFLKRVIDGIANSSYGLNVARMAGIGRDVLKEARHFQRQHFAEYDLGSQQGNLFTAIGIDDDESFFHNEGEEEEVLSRLRSYAVEHSSPIDALLLVKELQEMLKRQ